jgi:hypothetical protein
MGAEKTSDALRLMGATATMVSSGCPYRNIV